MASPSARGRARGAKSATAFRTISEVADELGVPQHVLRFWETRFVQVKPMKRNGGRRLYRPDHVALLRGIKALLYDDGLTIKGAQKILREQGTKSVVERGRGDLAEAPALPEDAPARLAALKARLGARESQPEAEDTPQLSDGDKARVQGSIARLEAILERLEES